MRETLGKIVNFSITLNCASLWIGLCIWLYLRWMRKGSEGSRRLLHRWAARRHFAIVGESMLNPFFNFVLNASKVQRIFEIEVRDAEGRARRADVICGHFFLGSLIGRVEARWKNGEGPKPDIEVLPPIDA